MNVKLSKNVYHSISNTNNPANIYLFKVNNRNTRKMCEICSKLTITTPEWRQWRSGVGTFNFEPFSSVSILGGYSFSGGFRGYRNGTLAWYNYFSREISLHQQSVNPLSVNPTKWSNTFKQFVVCCPRIFEDSDIF